MIQNTEAPRLQPSLASTSSISSAAPSNSNPSNYNHSSGEARHLSQESTQLLPISELTPLLLGDAAPHRQPVQVNIKTVIALLLVFIVGTSSLLAYLFPSSSIPGQKFTVPASFDSIRIRTTGYGDTLLNVYKHSDPSAGNFDFTTEFVDLVNNPRYTNISVQFGLTEDSFDILIVYDQYDLEPDVRTVVNAYLPYNLENFDMIDRKATLVWKGHNVANKFSFNTRVGNVNISKPLDCVDFNVITKVGSVHVKDLVIRRSGSILVENGDVDAKISGGYTSLEVETTKGGELDVILSQDDTVNTSLTSLETSTGNIRATVNGYNGDFSAMSELGRIVVEGANETPQSGHSTHGSVGKGTTGSQFYVMSGVGDISLNFKTINTNHQ
ncbi:UNVERIFIED_CONTAM: hypothetical protein HDU68_001825 [Siphonaria sp. JEL0065]|nr:hypothetical protein HDU68_001825 [Siphonaria sp. JEL0065]